VDGLIRPDPLGELTALPQTPKLDKGGGRGVGNRRRGTGEGKRGWEDPPMSEVR